MLGKVDKIANMFKETIEKFTFVDDIHRTLTAVADGFEQLKASVKAKTILTYAIAIGILAISLVTLADVNVENLLPALGAIGGLMVMLGLLTKQMPRIMNAFKEFSTQTKGFAAVKEILIISFMILTFATALSILAKTVAYLGQLKWNELLQGMAALAILMQLLTKTLKEFNVKIGGWELMAISSFAGALMTLASAVKLLGGMPFGELVKGVTAVSVVLVAFAFALDLITKNLTGFKKNWHTFSNKGKDIFQVVDATEKTAVSVKQLVGLIGVIFAFSAALMTMALAIKILSSVPVDRMVSSLIAIGVTMGVFALAIKFIHAGEVYKTALALAALGASMLPLAVALKILAGIEFFALVQAIVAAAVSITILTKAVSKLPTSDVVKAAASIAILSGAMIALSVALMLMSLLSLGSIVKGLIAVAASLLLFTVVVNVLPKDSELLKAAAAIGVIALAIDALSVAFLLFSLTGIGGVIAGVTALVAAIWILAGAAEILKKTNLIRTMNELAKTLLLFSISALGVSTALFVAATAFSMFAAFTGSDINRICDNLLVLIDRVPEIIAKFAQTVQNSIQGWIDLFTALIQILIQSVINNIPMIVELLKGAAVGLVEVFLAAAQPLLVGIVNIIFDVIQQVIIRFVDTIYVAISSFLGLLRNLGPEFAETMQVIADTLWSLTETIPSALLALGTIIGSSVAGIALIISGLLTGLILGVSQAILGTMGAIKDLIVGIITMVCQTIVETIGPIMEALAAIITAICMAIAESAPAIGQAISSVLVSIIQGLGPVVDELVRFVGEHILMNIPVLVGYVIDMIVALLNTIAEKLGDVIEAGINLILSFIEGLAEGIRNNRERAYNAMKELIKELIKTAVYFLSHSAEDIAGGVKEFVGNIINGIANGIRNGIDAVGRAVKSLVDGIFGRANEEAESRSPSKRAMRFAHWIDQGIIDTFNKEAKPVAQAMANTVDGAFKAIENQSLDMNSLVEPVDKTALDLNAAIDIVESSDPVVTPVLDLTEIQNGVKTMESMLDTQQIQAGVAVDGINAAVNSGNGFMLFSQLNSLISKLNNEPTGQTINLNMGDGIVYSSSNPADIGAYVTNMVEQASRNYARV